MTSPKTAGQKASAPADASIAPSAPDAQADRIAAIIRGHLRDSPISRDVNAWNHLQSKLPAIAEDILKEN
jgi:hypothetical protein